VYAVFRYTAEQSRSCCISSGAGATVSREAGADRLAVTELSRLAVCAGLESERSVCVCVCVCVRACCQSVAGCFHSQAGYRVLMKTLLRTRVCCTYSVWLPVVSR
jgi:hypothetical protein